MRLKKGDTREVSSDEEGFRGAWFSATILRKVGNVKGKTFLVEYRDLLTDDAKSKLKEKIKAHMIRPEPPPLNRNCFFLNEEVDAYDQDGWWVGVIYGILPQNKYIVYLSQTSEKLEYDMTQLRLHQDWTHNKWVNNLEVCVSTYFELVLNRFSLSIGGLDIHDCAGCGSSFQCIESKKIKAYFS